MFLIKAHHCVLPVAYMQVIKGLYSDTSFLVWNGHTKSGTGDINTFYQMLPNSTHSIQSFDCQPVSGKVAYQILKIY